MLSYDPLFKTMKEKGITGYQLIEKLGLSRRTYYRIKSGHHINTSTIIQLCQLLNCSVSEIIEYIPDEDNSQKLI
jgi:putative transcriptional regulator